MRFSSGSRGLAAACLAAVTPSALAHMQAGQATGFLTGFLHPISGLDHVLAMVAVGLWGAQLGAPAIWVLPVAFPLVTPIGGVERVEHLRRAGEHLADFPAVVAVAAEDSQ